MKLSVVIGTRNGADTIGEQLDALASQGSRHQPEVVVSDNGSTDDTAAVAERYSDRFERLIVVDSSEVAGASHARNVGAAAATGDYLLFCDDDDVVAPGWLDAMAAALERHPFVAARLDHRHLNPSWTVFAYGEPQEHELPGRSFLPYAWGGSIGIRRDIHVAIGGFDERYRQSGEDNDYCYRIQLAGTPLHFASEAAVYYRHRRDERAIFRQFRGYGREWARLAMKFREYRMVDSRLADGFAKWALLVARLPFSMHTKARRAKWLASLGWRVGRLEQSVRQRYLVL
jgi:GT2 family glycosyltransferase